MNRLFQMAAIPLSLFGAGIFLLLSAGCSHIPMYPTPNSAAPAPPPAPVGSPDSAANPVVAPGSADLLQVGNKLFITFSDIPNPSPPFEETIREDGQITLPLDQKAVAAGKTKGQLADEIHALYVPKYYLRLTVTLKTEDRFFIVGGEVRSPARQIYLGQMSVLRAIASSGGFTEFARRTKVQIIRADKSNVTMNCDKALKDPRLDLPIFPGDQINVPRRLF